MIRIVSGRNGARTASESSATAIVVDALRSSATLAAALAAEAKEVLVCGDPSAARTAAGRIKDALLVGEWESVTPEGFHLDNSPTAVAGAELRGRNVIFTSSNGAGILIACRGAERIVIGGPTNAGPAAAAARRALLSGSEVVIIPAGELGKESTEDMAGAVLLASLIGPDIDPAQEELIFGWLGRIASRGLEKLFRESRRGFELTGLGLERDVAAAATPDLYPVLPEVVEFTSFDGMTACKVKAALDTGAADDKITLLANGNRRK